MAPASFSFSGIPAPHSHARLPAFILALALPVAVIGCAGNTTAPTKTAAIGEWGVDLANMHANTDPGDDFYRHVNGTWLASTKIPADLAGTGAGMELHLQAEADVRQIIQDLAASSPSPGSVEQQVGDLYASWIDVERLEALGTAPLKPFLAEIATIDDRDTLQSAFASLTYSAPFSISIIPDPADTTRYAVTVGQGGLGLPGRDYYLDDSERFQAWRIAYRDYIAELLELAGVDDAAGKAGRILALETRIAESHWPPEASRDIQKIYNPMNLEQLSALAPELDWRAMFERLELADVGTFIVGETTALDAAAELVATAPLETWKAWLAFHFINDHTSSLSTAFDRASFDFYSKTLNGVETQRERGKRGVQFVNGAMGEAVGQVYAKRHFPPGHKARMEELVGHLVAAFRERLEANTWMDEETRKQALAKLATFEPRVGYPEKWTDYAALEIRGDDLFGNRMRLTEFHWQRQLDRIGKPVDRESWQGMNVQTVNAFYNPLMNQITFPAAILQPPLFDPNADAAVNYGAIGAVIGHEIGHGFDDQGRRFDEAGRIRDWWTPEANERFSERAQRLGAQYAQYEPVEGIHINPGLTMGENIGDLGGLETAYAAYHRHLDACCNGEAPVIDGYTGDQRFFLAFAASWRRVQRDDFLRMQLKTDPHSPPEYRVNGVVRNMDAWYDAFDVTADDKLYLPPEQRVRIW